jgi:isochorismate synthase
VLLGASPELLVSRSKLHVVANPLAGSAPRSVEPVEDQYRGGALLASQKDQREHAFVVEAVVEALRPLCVDLRVPKEPSLLGTAKMWHLSTEIHGRLRDPETCSLRLATALHPTPAVCGTPREQAMGAIRELEGFNREFYAGFVGWSDATGDGEWVVTIRCGDVEDRRIRIFAGAGIVDASHPENELDETSAKLNTVLSALGIERC